MADYEQYGDYSTTEEDREAEHPKSVVGRVLKAIVVLFLVFLCGLIAFRLFLSGYYPRSMKKLYMTDALSLYAETERLDVEKEKIDIPYDDSKNASFMADNLLLERGAGAVQFSLRFSPDVTGTLRDRLGLEEKPELTDSLFVFRLTDNSGRSYSPSHMQSDTYLWYHAVKLCFDGVDLSDGVAWIRVDIFETVGGLPDEAAEPYASVPVIVRVAEIGS